MHRGLYDGAESMDEGANMGEKKRFKTVALVLAGGQGGRLDPLTRRRSKPVMPFGGTYRLIDIALSNLHHSQLSDVWVVEQYRPHGLNDHLNGGRPWDLDRTRGGLVVMPPFEGKDEDKDGFAGGNAEALSLQREFLEQAAPDFVLVLSADHLYRFDYRDLIDFHVSQKADLSVLLWEAPEQLDLTRYSLFDIEGEKVTGFAYKPDEPKSNLVGTEVFLYTTSVLLDTLDKLHEEHGEKIGDYGDHLLPRMVKEHKVRAMTLEGYWRDVGTIDSYWQAHQDLLADLPEFPLDDVEWPILTEQPFRSPARIEGTATIERSLISPSCRIEGTVRRSVIGPGCLIEKGAVVEDSVLLDGCRIGSSGRLKKAIVEAGSELDQPFGDGEKVQVYYPEGKSLAKSLRTRRPFD